MVGVSLSGVTKRFGSVVAADDVTLEIRRGMLFFLLGPSGCGKTTLLRIIAGFEHPDAGSVRFDDRVIDDVPPHRRNAGMVFQNYALWPHLSVADNVAYGLSVRRVSRRERRRRVAEALEMVHMAGYGRRVPAQLSGGQQQRVALARALVIEPDVILLDEPLSNLDAKLRLEMRAEIMRIHQATGITTIYVTHDQKEALSVAERLAVIRDGRIEQVGSPRDVYRRPESEFVATFVGEANTLVGTVEESAGDVIRVGTPLGRVTAVGDAPVGSVVACCVRPETCFVSRRSSKNKPPSGAAGEYEAVCPYCRSAVRRGADYCPRCGAGIGPESADRSGNVLPARLVRRTYLGDVEQYDLVVGEDLPWKATRLNPRESLEPGEAPVSIQFAPGDVMVFPR